jgi:hypothetical protein
MLPAAADAMLGQIETQACAERKPKPALSPMSTSWMT